ncbi:MAG: UvrD-helicase domain-containing protein [Phycisphaerales bacterium]
MTAALNRTKSNHPFEVVMASAGTGKTFTLTNKLAGLLARGVAPERVLAATFTRQAAGEIRERLLTRIASAAEDEAAAADLSEHAGVSLDTSGWLNVLGRLGRSIHRVRMGTLDSTAQSLARSLAPQLGLIAPWRQAFEHAEEQLRSEVVERLLQERATAEERAAIRLLAGQEGSASGDERLAELLADSGAQLRRAAQDAWNCLADESSHGPTMDDVRASAARLRDIAGPTNKDGKTPNKQFVNARAAVLDALEAGDHAGLLKKTLVACCEQAAPTYHRIDVPPEWLAELRTILRGVVRAELGLLHERNLVAGELLRQAVQIEDVVRREHRAYSLGDLWRALAECDLDSQQVAYRMDAQFDHILLDEFQDTSIDQWRVLAPLIDEAVAGGDRDRSVFIVGDVKQSLYGWRNAQAALLPYVAHRWPQMHTRPLNETYRCRGTIVEAVNRVFGGLDSNPSLEGHDAARDRFADQFMPHVSAVPGEGQVRIVDLSATLDDPDDEDAAVAAVADAVAAVHQRRPGAEVAVLVRRQKLIGKIVAALAARDVPAVSSASASPCDHPVVEAVLSALHLAAHPGDGPSRFAIATGPLGAALGLERWEDRDDARRVSRDLAMRIFEHGLARTVEWLAGLAGRSANQRGRARLGDLVSLAEAYEKELSEASGIDDFIGYVRTSRVRPRSSGLVRVLTLHAAKGLQFDAVFLTDIDGQLATRGPAFLADAGGAEVDDPTAAPTRMSLSGTKELRAHCPRLHEMYERWRERAAYEELCLLYVGMTRAKAHLELFVRSSKKGLGTVAWHGLGATGAEHVEGSPGWADEPADAPAVHQPAPPSWARPEAMPKGWSGPDEPWRIAALRPSDLQPEHEVSRLLSIDARAADLGAEVHRLLEGVAWLEETLSDPADWVDESGPRTAEAADRIRRALAGDALPGVLSRTGVSRRMGEGLDLSVERERPISAIVEVRGRPTLVRGRIDRLILGRDRGRPVRCLIVDFKTGGATDEGRDQIELYRLALAEVLGVAVDEVDAELVEV